MATVTGSSHPDSSSDRLSPHGDVVQTGSGETRPRIVADAGLASLFRTSDSAPGRPSRALRYLGFVLVGVLVLVVGAALVVRHLTGGGPEPAAAGPAATAAASTGAPAASGAAPTPAARRSSVAPGAGTTAPSPLTAVVNPGDTAGGEMRTAAAVALAGNRAIHLGSHARQALLSGSVDVRLTTVLATLAGITPLQIGDFSEVAGDPASAPLRQVVVTTVDPSALADFDQALAEQVGDYAMEVVADGSDGQLIRLATAGR